MWFVIIYKGRGVDRGSGRRVKISGRLIAKHLNCPGILLRSFLYFPNKIHLSQ